MSFSHIAACPFEPVPLESTRVHIMTLVPVLTQRVSKLMPRILLLFPLLAKPPHLASYPYSFPVLCDRSGHASHILHVSLSLAYCHINLSMVMLIVWMSSLSPFYFVVWMFPFLLLSSRWLPAHT